MDGAGGVRAVAVLDAAEVEDDHVAFLDRPLAHLVMRVGAVRARADDGEVHLRVPVVAEEAREVGGDLALAAAREPDLLAICSKHASAAAPAAASRSSSSAPLIARSIGSVLVIETYVESGNACCRASTCIAQAESEIA